MGLYVDLSQEDKDLLAVFERNARGYFNGIISRGIVEARALEAALDAENGAGDILNSLNVGEVIPNSGGLAGVQDLTKGEWNTLTTTILKSFTTKHDTPPIRELLAKAAGPTAGLD